jgi:xanthine/uracil permease
MLERNRKAYEFAPKTHSRNAIWLAMMALLFIVFGIYSEFRFMSAYLIAFGVVMLCGAAFSLFNGRRIAKLALPNGPKRS